MILGLNNGGFYRFNQDRLSAQVINKIIEAGVNGLELTCSKIEMIDTLFDFELPKNKLEFISLHAPMLDYRNDSTTLALLNKILQINERLKFNNIIIHSDNIKDLGVFKSFEHLPFSIENSDHRKEFGKSVNDIKAILDQSNFKLTLDLQHCYVNDNTMKLAYDFYNEFGNKIVEFHVSGYDKNFNHYTLYKTKQDIILDFFKGKNTPIILESTYDSYDEANTEINYIKNKLIE